MVIEARTGYPAAASPYRNTAAAAAGASTGSSGHDSDCTPSPPPTHSLPLHAQAPSRTLVHPQARALAVRSTCIHTQLRDLLVCPEIRGEVIANSYQSMARYTFPSSDRRSGEASSSSRGRRKQSERLSERSGKGHDATLTDRAGSKHTLQQLAFIPNVLVKGCGLLAAGGHQAELFLRSSSPFESWSLSTLIGASINNSISISPSPTHPLSIPNLLISNNDANIYRYELHFPKKYASMEREEEEGEGEKPKLKRLGEVRLDTPVNHTSPSNDGKWMVAVGDTNEVHVMNVNAMGQVSNTCSFEATTDASFSTSWSRTGQQFAVASQDGTVSIYDIRRLPCSSSSSSSSQPLARFRTTYSGSTIGAARVVKYSPGPHELLAFSEQKGYIHLVDARTYEHRESIHIADIELQEAARAISVPQTGIARIMRQQMLETRGAWDSENAGTGEYEDPINVRTRAIAQAAIERGSSASSRILNHQNFPGISAPGSLNDMSVDELVGRRRHPLLLGSPEASSPAARTSAGNNNSSRSTIEARESRMREILAQLPTLPRTLRSAATSATTTGLASREGAAPTRLPALPVRSVNPWDTFSTDDFSTSSASSYRARDEDGSLDERLAHLRAMRDEALRAADGMDDFEEGAEDLDAEEDEDIDMEDDELYHREILEAARQHEEQEGEEEALFAEDRRGRLADLDHGDEQLAEEWCPVVPDDEGEENRRGYLSLFGQGQQQQQRNGDSRVPPSGTRAGRGGQALALPSSSSSWLSSASESDDRSFSLPTSSSRSPLTVFQLLNSLWAEPAGPGGASITGLDWDPSGRWLYTSLERVVLEWEVNEAGRKCLPSAGWL